MKELCQDLKASEELNPLEMSDSNPKKRKFHQYVAGGAGGSFSRGGKSGGFTFSRGKAASFRGRGSGRGGGSGGRGGKSIFKFED